MVLWAGPANKGHWSLDWSTSQGVRLFGSCPLDQFDVAGKSSGPQSHRQPGLHSMAVGVLNVERIDPREEFD